MEQKIVVIDAGHGGTDPGAVSGSAYEKTRTLQIALELRRQLQACGIQVVMTRTGDSNPTLGQRTAIEQAAKADCCISCHMDAAAASASGMSIWIHSNANQAIVFWAQDTLTRLKAVGFTSNRAQEICKGYRGNSTLDYAWNRDTRSPSMLIEFGFLTNPANLKEFDSKYPQYAAAVTQAVCAFLQVSEPQQTPTQPTPIQPSQPDTPQGDTQQTKRYYVQIGVFEKMENAQSYAAQAQKDGYQTVIKYQ